MDRIVLYCVLALATLSPVEFLGVSAGFGLAGGGFRPGSAEQERCPKDQIPVKVTVKVELMENAVLEDYTHYKESRSQSSFKERYDELDVSASVSGGVAGFSAGASAAYRDVASSADSSRRRVVVEKTFEKTRFDPEFKQLFKIVTRTLHIGDTFSTTTTRMWIETVRIGTDMSSAELKQLAEKVVEREYGHITTGQVQGSTFTERNCMIKKACTDTPSWNDGAGENCQDYRTKYCKVNSAGPFAGGSWNFPEKNCCGCGKDYYGQGGLEVQRKSKVCARATLYGISASYGPGC